MNIFSAIRENLRLWFAPKPETPTVVEVSPPNPPKTDAIQPIVVTPAGNPVPPAPPVKAPEVSNSSAENKAAVLAPPAPVDTAPQEKPQEPTKKQSKPRTPKVAPQPKQQPTPSAAPKAKKKKG